MDSAGLLNVSTWVQKLILSLLVKFEFLAWKRLELAPGTPLDGFSMSFTYGFVGSNMIFDVFFKKTIIARTFVPPL